jgi:hypothetical protein
MQIQSIERPRAVPSGRLQHRPARIAASGVGVAGVVSAVVLGAVLLAVDAPPLARAMVVFPLWGAIIGFEQARRRFCAGFAFAGIRSAAGSDATESVADRADLAADRATARRMVAYCGAIAVALTALFVLLPV